GMASLAASGLMKKLLAAFRTLNPVASAAAAVGLIALGSMLQGAAQRSFGEGGSMRSSMASGAGLSDSSTTIAIGTAGLSRTNTSGLSTLAAAGARPSPSIDGAFLPKPVPNVMVTGNTFASPFDPVWQRQITETVKQAQRGGV